MASKALLLIVIFGLFELSTSLVSSFSECDAAGFAAGTVACATCNELAKVLGISDDTVENCKRCCSKTIDWALPKKYDSAVLQINRMGVEQHGGVKEWLDKSATKFADRVEIVESFVSTPTLVLKTDDDADENDGATTSKGKKAKAKKSRGSGFDNLFGVGEGSAINIGSWKIEHIDAFLVSKLKSAGDS